MHVLHKVQNISTTKNLTPKKQVLTLQRPLNTEILNEKAVIPDKLLLPVSKGATLWVNNVYGYKKYFILYVDFAVTVRRFFRRPQKPDLAETYFHRFFETYGIEVTKIIPRRKEDGCYLFFEDTAMAKKAQQFILSTTQDRTPIHEVFFVLGAPLIEDISMLKPNKKLIVSSKGYLTEDNLFRMFRPFGKIQEINNKSVHDVYIVFIKSRFAISARNCLHNTGEGDMKIQVKYIKPKRLQYWGWMSKQYSPLILVVILLVLVVILIEPLRLLLVLWNLETDLIEKDLNTIPGDTIRDDDIVTLLNKLKLAPLMILSGPSECGRTQLVERFLEHQPFTILVDFDNSKLTSGAPIDDGLLESLGGSIGYRPTFKVVNETRTAIQVLMGGKEDMLTTSKLSQMNRLLDTLGNALKITKKFSKKKPIILFDKFNEFMERVAECSPEEQKNVSNFIKHLIMWSERICTKDKTATIVYVGNSMTKLKMVKYASKQSRVIEVFHLEDLSKEKAREALLKEEIPAKTTKIWWRPSFKKEELKSTPKKYFKEEDFEVMWGIIGGRPAHLLQVKKALKEGKNIAEYSKSLLGHEKMVVNMDAIGDSPGNSTPSNKWTKVQFWKIIRLLVEAGDTGVPRDVLVEACGGDPQPVYSLTNTNWIMRVHSSNFHDIDRYSTPSPLRRETYKEILKDEGLRKRIGPLEEEERVKEREKEISLRKRIIITNLEMERYGGVDLKEYSDMDLKEYSDIELFDK